MKDIDSDNFVKIDLEKITVMRVLNIDSKLSSVMDAPHMPDRPKY